jgi:hypothetical protein
MLLRTVLHLEGAIDYDPRRRKRQGGDAEEATAVMWALREHRPPLTDENGRGWEDAADEYASLVNAWWSDGFKTCMKTSTAITAGIQEVL